MLLYGIYGFSSTAAAPNEKKKKNNNNTKRYYNNIMYARHAVATMSLFLPETYIIYYKRLQRQNIYNIIKYIWGALLSVFRAHTRPHSCCIIYTRNITTHNRVRVRLRARSREVFSRALQSTPPAVLFSFPSICNCKIRAVYTRYSLPCEIFDDEKTISRYYT